MKNLLYKEFKIAINPLFYFLPLLSALLLIPNWLYFIALSYAFFITVPNIFTTCKAQNDIGFSVMLPVRKRDIVKARFISVIALEMLHIIVAVIFAIINSKLYPQGNFLLEPNAAFFGFALIMFSIYNTIFLIMFYKSAYKIAVPVIVALIPTFIFTASVEFLIQFVPDLKMVLDSTDPVMLIWQLPVLAAGIIIFVLSAVVSYKISAKRFEKIDI